MRTTVDDALGVHTLVPGPYSGTGSPTPTPVGARRARHVLKCQPDSFASIWAGTRHHDVRKDDRDLREGDDVVFREWIPEDIRGAAVREALEAEIEDEAVFEQTGYTRREVLVRIGATTTSARWPDLLGWGNAIAFDFTEVARCTDGSISRSVHA